MIPVTKPFLAPQEYYQKYLDGIWERNWLTNHGPLTLELEESLKNFLDVAHLKLVTNGTIAIQFAIRALDIKGEIITTPFSYVASTSSISWENCEPVFVDIDRSTFNIDPSEIEKAVTKNTKAILATHVFGNPCDVLEIERIANRHNLKVIYDAAHAFNVRIGNISVFNYGDVSTTSFHATKIFHMIEGGAVVTKSEELDYKISRMRNFGHKGPENFDGIGINGKVSEFHSAMGLLNLKFAGEIQTKRKHQSELYRKYLNQSNLQYQHIDENVDYNYAYFPVLFESESQLKNVISALNSWDIFPRRYFYPLLTELPYVNKVDLPQAESISSRILCLPLYHTLKDQEIERISDIILNSISSIA